MNIGKRGRSPNFDNTAAIKAERSENEEMIAWYDAHLPPRPLPYIHKPLPIPGKKAYHPYNKPGIVTELDVARHGIVVNDRWGRLNEWSSEPWSDKDRKALNEAQLAIAREWEKREDAVREAWRERLALRKKFTGR